MGIRTGILFFIIMLVNDYIKGAEIPSAFFSQYEMTPTGGQPFDEFYWLNTNNALLTKASVSFPSSGTYRCDISAYKDAGTPNISVSINGSVVGNISITTSTIGIFSVSIPNITAGTYTVVLQLTNFSSATNYGKIGLVYFTPSSLTQPPVNPVITPLPFTMGTTLIQQNHYGSHFLRGFNLGSNAYNQSNANGGNKQAMIDMVATGANIARCFVQIERPSGDTYQFKAGELEKLDTTIIRAARYGYLVVPVLFADPSLNTDYWGNDARKASIAHLWRTIATSYNGNKYVGGYDLINEPRSNFNYAEVIRFEQQMIDTIRLIDANHVVMIEPISNDMFAMMLPVPYTNVVYSPHGYSTLKITHQGVAGESSANVRNVYPTVTSTSNLTAPWGITQLSAQHDDVRTMAHRFNVPVFIGEFSCINWSPINGSGVWTSTKWCDDNISLLETEGWSWVYHAWRGDYPGWESEIPSSYYNAFTFVNAAPQGLPSYSGWVANRSATAPTIIMLEGYFKNNIAPNAYPDTFPYTHPIIVVQNKHYITNWGQFGNFDTSIVQAGTNLGGGYIKKQGTKNRHLVLINEGGTVSMNGIEIDDCAYLDFIGYGSADPYGFLMNATKNGFAVPIEGKSHDLQFMGINIEGGTQEGFTAKIEADDFASKYLCDTSYAFYIQRNIRISNCKVRNNGNEGAYMNSTGWDSRDQVHGNAPFFGCPIANNNKFDPNDAADTITNSGTFTNKIFLDNRICSINKAFNFRCVINRLSGTISGNIILSSSPNGNTYTGVQTQVLTNVANNTYQFNVSSSTVQYWKIDIVTSGTMSATFKSYSQFFYYPPASDSIFVDSSVFIAPGRSAVNFSNLSHGYFRGNKGWHIGRELNSAQGKMIAIGGKTGYLGDTTYVIGNKCFGSYLNNFWTVGEGYIWFENNFGDSAGYYATILNPQQTPSTNFGVTVGRTVPVTWKICNNAFYLNTSSPSTQYAIDEGAQVTTNNVIGGNIGTFDQFNITYSTNCGAVANQPPVCNPGSNVTLTLPQNSYFFVNASASDPDGTITTYAWTQVSGGSYTIDNAAILKPTVSNLSVGTYIFKLTVTDNNGATANKNITITVNPAPNQKPNVNAGSDIILTLPVNSYAISDASASDPDGSISTYLWQKVSGGAATISNPAILLPTISNLVQGTYLFSLTVTDNGGLSNTDTMQIVVNHALNQPPICYAGNNVVITLPVNSYTFSDATASDPDGSIVAYRWTLVNGGSYTIDDATILHPTVSNLTAGTYMFRLRVTDDSGATAQSQVTIVVNNAPNVPPICNAGNDTTLTLPTNSYQTHATASDQDGTIVSYLWTKFQGGTATISNPNILLPLISNLNADIYGLSLTVTDNNGASFTDTIYITVNPAPNIPPICNAGGNVVLTLPTNSYQINASASDADGVIVSYAWTQVSGGSYTISNASVLNPLFSNLTQGVYKFRLTVTDNSGATAQSTIQITVNHALNVPPSVNAGVDRTITLPTNSVQISGATATDVDGTIVSTVWTKLSGGSYTISNPNALNPLFSNLTQGVYVFILAATDDSAAVSRDTMTITVNHALNRPPTVNAGNDTTIQLPATTINLIGTASDPDGNIVSNVWSNSDGCSITSPSSLSTTATCSTTGTHLFTLTVIDDSSVTVFDNKQAIVLPAINIPPTAIASHDTTVYEPIDSLVLTQSGTDPDGSITAYLTSIYSSNFSPIVTNATTTHPIVKGLQQGDTIKVLLRVMDNNNIFGYDTTTIIVLPDTVNNPPVIVVVRVPNTNKPRQPLGTVTLDASQSYDNDAGDYIASFVWEQLSGDLSVIMSGANGQVLTLSNLKVGDYSFLLTITDSKGAEDTQIINVTVLEAVRVKVTKSKIRQ